MHFKSLKTIAICSIAVCLTLIICPQSTHTSPQKIAAPQISDNLFVEVPVDSLNVQADTSTPIERIQIPKFARQLHGQRVRMHGVMYFPFEPKGLTHFFFVPQTKQRSISGWGSIQPLHAMILVTTATGHTEDYEKQPFTIEGIFTVDIHSHDGEVQFIYHIRDAKIVNKNIHLQYKPALSMFGC